ncbi:methyltransferase domain-containing protein [Halorubrum sp. SS5]|nr:methyltransferase domain-containing protein [Halorubrum sp. SS5]
MLDNEARYRRIQPYILGKKVLDIGIVQHDLENVESDDWIHGRVVEDASKVVGIDILEQEIRALQERGYDARVADAENFDLDETFEVVLAGELIEHLSNLGGFLESCYRHLNSDGKLILTTPNGMSIVFPARRLLNHDIFNPQHTCIFDEQTLTQLLAKHGFTVEEINFIQTNQVHSLHPKQIMTELLESVPPGPVSNQTLMIVASPNEESS